MISKIIAENKIQQAQNLLEEADKIVLVTHLSPDGDALGSSLGMYHFLLNLGKQANVIVPNAFPTFLSWMKGANDVLVYEDYPDLAAETIEAADLILCLDFNVPKRIGGLAPLVLASRAKKILIDHHLEPENFCDVTISYPQIPATAELVFRFICRMGYFDYINKEVAECIYTGLMTDTGGFSFNSNQPELYVIVSELLKKGIDKDEIYTKVCNTYSENSVRLRGYMTYEKMRVLPELHTAIMTLSLEEATRFKLEKGDTEGLVNVPLGIVGVVFSVFFKEEKEVVRISFRSTGTFPANKVAAEVFGGGGHLNAAGGEYYGSVDEAIQLLIESLPAYF